MKLFATFFVIIAVCLATLLCLPHTSAQEKTEVAPSVPLAPGTPSASAGTPVTEAGTWEVIKDYTYAQRAEFIATVGRMMDKVDEQIQQQNAKRDTLTESTAKDWDIAIKDLEEARSLVQSKVTELSKTKPETWDAAKEQVGIAWQRVQNALDKVRASTTS